MIKLTLIILIIIFVLNLIIMRIYSSIYKSVKKLKKRNNEPLNISTKKNILNIFKSYLFAFCNLNLIVIGLIPSFHIRQFLYKNIFLMKIGKGSKIRGFVEIISPWNIEIGKNTMIGKNVKLDGRNGLKIGNNVNISDCTAIWTEQHDINDEYFRSLNSNGQVIIKDRVWLCFRSIILPNIVIDEGAVVASGTIVTKNIKEFSLYTGIPAERKKERNKSLNYELNLTGFHFY